MKYPLLFAICFIISLTLHGQVFTNKEVGKKNTALADSLKESEYPYVLPIWGKKAAKAGYNLPYSAGMSVNYLWQRSELILNNMQVGFNNGPMYNVDEVVRFDKAQAETNSVTVRPDIWLFPFLNVYGILGKSSASTTVGYGIWVPDSTNTAKEVFSAESKVKFNATTFGIGMTPTIGVGGGFLALDMNCAWTDVPQLSKPAFTFIFGPRLGKAFKLQKPNRAIAIWAGGFRVQLKSGTDGSVNLSEVLPVDELGGKIQSGYAKVGAAQQQVDTWWSNLTPVEQKNPINAAKHDAANSALGKAGQILAGAEAAIGNLTSSTVQYKMDKRPKDKWNFIIGSQFQLNKRWMIRAEYGFLTSRKQFLTSVQYRFGL